MRQAFPYRMQRALPAPPSAATELWESYHFAPEDEFSLREYWATIRQHYLLILVLFIAAEALTALVLALKTPLYTATSTILIEPETPQVLEPQVQAQLSDNDTNSFYRTQYEILQSRSLAAAVIRNLALDKDPHFTEARAQSKGLSHSSLGPLFPLHVIGAFVVREIGNIQSWFRGLFISGQLHEPADGKPIIGVSSDLIDAYLGGLSIRPDFETRLVTIAYTSPDPAFAAKIANAHVLAFVQKSYELHNENNEVARHYLESELVKLERRLEKSEEALNNYRKARGIVTLSPGDEDPTVAERMTALAKGLIDAEETRIALQAEVETIKGKNFDAVPEVVNSELIQRLKQEVSRLDGEYASLSNQFTRDYPPVAQLRAQLNDARRHLQTEIRRVVNSVKASYTAAQGRENKLRAQVEAEKSRVMRLKNASLQDAVLAREAETNRVLYKNVLERIKMLGVASEARVTNVSTVDPAEIPTTCSSPKKKLCLVLSGFLALLVGVSLAFLIEGADRGLKDAAEVQSYLGVPNLATIVRFSKADQAAIIQSETPLMLAGSDGPSPALNSLAAREARSLGHTVAVAGEAYRAVRTGILLSRSEERPKTILFTSATVGEGKSVTAINTAIAFSSLVDRVLLIDADLRRPRCHQILDQTDGAGLAEVLTGLSTLEEAVQPTAVDRLFLLSAGTTPPNPSELLGSKRMLEVLAAVSSEYDHVLIDSPPILPVSDSVVLSTLVDGVVLVAGRQTPKNAVRDACARLAYVGARIVGAVLNNVDLERERYHAPHMYY